MKKDSSVLFVLTAGTPGYPYKGGSRNEMADQSGEDIAVTRRRAIAGDYFAPARS
jgi:hypothetical protein